MKKRKKLISLIYCFAFFYTNAFASEQTIGIGIHANKYDLENDNLLQLIEKSGFNSFRQDLTWDSVERTKGVYAIPPKLKLVDEIIRGAKKYNISPLVILDYGNKNYNNGGYPTNEQDIAAFAKYAKWVASNYKGQVKYYEIWNEWTVGTGMKGKGEIPPPQIYLELVKKTSQAIKSVDPSAIILAGSFNPLSPTGRRLNISDSDWFTILINEGILNYIDGISIHPYSFLNANKKLRNPEYNINKIDQFYNKIKDQNIKKVPLYITEIGIPTHAGLGGVDPLEAADYVVKYSLLAKSKSYIKGIWWYDLSNDGGDMKNQEHNFGFYDSNFNPKPAAKAFINLQKFLNNKRIDKISTTNTNNAQQFNIEVKDSLTQKDYTIYWNEKQLEQNGRIPYFGIKKLSAQNSENFDQKNLSRDVSVK